MCCSFEQSQCDVQLHPWEISSCPANSQPADGSHVSCLLHAAPVPETRKFIIAVRTSDVGFSNVQHVRTSNTAQSLCVKPQLYSCTVRLFGLRNAPATFQRIMNRVVSELTSKLCLTFWQSKRKYVKVVGTSLCKVVGQGRPIRAKVDVFPPRTVKKEIWHTKAIIGENWGNFLWNFVLTC